MLAFATDSGMPTAFRPNPPNCCPNEGELSDENGVDCGGGGLGWWAGTPMAIPLRCAGGAEIEDGAEDGNEGTEEEEEEGGSE